ncbi:MAG: hypothetical protein V4513_06680 [Pseudomonadota bacterium]
MRALILFAGATLVLTGCGKNDQSGATNNVGADLTAEKIVANDVTAIDAVTADAANMAADMNYEALDNVADNATGNSTANPGDKPRRSSSRPARTAPAANATDTNSAD